MFTRPCEAALCFCGRLLRRRWLRALPIFFVEIGMAIIEAGELTFDEKVLHLGLQLERIAVGHDDVAEFS